jgi:diguanylate cyclase (GGDEF)-like protein
MIKKRVLIFEVNEKNFNSLEKILGSKGYESINYTNVDDFKEQLQSIDIALINTHIDYIDIEKIDKHINEHFAVKIPMIFLDNSKEPDQILMQKCYDNGASDFIKRPFGSKEILARLNYHFELVYKMREYKLRVDKLAHLATVDQMSKLTSKMHMQAILKNQLNTFNSDKDSITILFIGLMSVDKVVSMFGFEYGEKFIQSFSKHLKALVKEPDAIARWSGSNFMILLSQTDVKKAQILAKKLYTSLSNIEILKNTKPTVAFGITEFIEDDSVEEIEQRAVYALKEAKKQEYGKIAVL